MNENDTVYFVIGLIPGSVSEIWGVAVYDNEDAAQQHRKQASAETRRIQSNVQRAVNLRGKPFSQETEDRFRAGNRYDPQMRLSGDVMYFVLQAPWMRQND